MEFATDRVSSDPSAVPCAVDSQLSDLYQRLRHVIPEIEWRVHAEYIVEIEKLKVERNAVILAHNYQSPEIFHGVADLTGDSLALARGVQEIEADVIVLCGAHFMAETAKILNPEKIVVIPSTEAGCSLAASITAEDVRGLKQQHPGVPVVTYVNTSAEVKAESNICCTSGNAVAVVESLGVDKVIFLPDEYLGLHVAQNTAVEIVLWKGHCEVHERFSASDLQPYRSQHKGIQILAHPECPPDVLQMADYVGSTAGMIGYVDQHRPSSVLLVTECSMSDNLAVEFPDLEFVRPCALCPHMKTSTLPRIQQALLSLEPQVRVPEAVATRARRAVEAMLRI